MLQISLWSRLLTLIVLAAGILIALPNALPRMCVNGSRNSCPAQAVNLGLDLQGGSYLLLEVDFDQVSRDQAESLVGDIRAALAQSAYRLTDLSAHGDTVSVRITDTGRMDEARTLIAGPQSQHGRFGPVGGRQGI